MAKGKKSALALAKERKRKEHIKSLIETWNEESTPITPTYDELPTQSEQSNKWKSAADAISKIFKGTNKNQVQVNWTIDLPKKN